MRNENGNIDIPGTVVRNTLVGTAFDFGKQKPWASEYCPRLHHTSAYHTHRVETQAVVWVLR